MNFHTRKWIKPQDLNPNRSLFGGRLLEWIDEEAALYAIIQLENPRTVTKYISFSIQVMFVNFGNKEAQFCLPILQQLRQNGITAELYPAADKMKKQMSYANNRNVKSVILIGEDEMSSGLLSVKNMQTGDQYNISLEKFIKQQL